VTTLLVILYVLVCIFLILVVLLQQGKGADLAGAFGGGGSQASFGPRSSTSIMHRLTTVSFVLFVVLSISLAVFQGRSSSSVMEDVPVQAPAEEPVADVGETLPAPAAVEESPAAEDVEQAAPIEEPAVPVEEPADSGAGQ
jgi:preprotein translocase subunit SecG